MSPPRLQTSAPAPLPLIDMFEGLLMVVVVAVQLPPVVAAATEAAVREGGRACPSTPRALSTRACVARMLLASRVARRNAMTGGRSSRWVAAPRGYGWSAPTREPFSPPADDDDDADDADDADDEEVEEEEPATCP